MRYIATGITLAGLAGCAWFGGDASEDEGESERTKVGYTTFELYDTGAPASAIDPVSGEWLPRDTAHKTLYEGLTYFFTSRENMEAFERRPHEFVTADGYLKKPLEDVRREAEVR